MTRMFPIRMPIRHQVLSEASAAERRQAAASIFPLLSQFWTGLDLDHLIEDYFGADLVICELLTRWDQAGLAEAIVGLARDVDVGSDRITQLDAVMFKRPDTPASMLMRGFLAQGLLKGAAHAMRERRTLVIFGPGSPAGYRMLREMLPSAIPRPEGQPTDREARIYDALWAQHGWTRDPQHPYAANTGVQYRGRRRARALTSKDPDVRFYVEQCPDFMRGSELIVLILLEPRQIPGVLLRIGWSGGAAVRRRLGRRRLSRRRLSRHVRRPG